MKKCLQILCMSRILYESAFIMDLTQAMFIAAVDILQNLQKFTQIRTLAKI